MKRKERHHLKENELVHSIETARDFLETRQRQITGAVVGIVVLALAVIGFLVYRSQTQSRGSELLAEALVALNARVVPTGATGEESLPAGATLGATGTFSTEEAKLKAALPKLKAAADAYPDSASGITAVPTWPAPSPRSGGIRRRSPSSTRSSSGVVHRACMVGWRGSARPTRRRIRGQLDAAIATWKEMTTGNNDDLPVDAILMELARAYVQKGNTEEARKTFTQIVDQHPNSPYLREARTELENLKG